MKFGFSMVLAACALAASCASGRTWEIAPGPDATTSLQQALIEAQEGDTVRLREGRYLVAAGLSLDVDGVTIQGAGTDQTILDFSGQTQGAEGLLVTADRVTLRDFAVENARGDAIKARGCDQITFLRVRAEWTRGPHPENGAYGLYPVNCTNVLIDRSIARGASDAGIYVGQSRNIIVRNSVAELNVAGIEIENSFNADVYGNIATRNTGGILVFDLPGLPQVGGRDVRVFRNRIVDNNTPNFAPPGNIVAGVPAGAGMLVMANENVHIFENSFEENGSVNVLIVAYSLAIPDQAYNPLPRDIVVRNNVFGRTGFRPGGDLAALAQAGVPLPDVLWDGAETYNAAGAPRSQPVRITLRANVAQGRVPSFLSLGLGVAGSEFTEAAPTAALPIAAGGTEPPEVRLPQD